MRRVLLAVIATALMISTTACTKDPDLKRDPHTKMIVHAVTDATSAAMEQARSAIANRARAAGLGKATVTRQGDLDLVVEVPGQPDAATMNSLAAVGEMQFRKVLAVTNGRDSAVTPAQSSARPALAEVATKLGTAYVSAQALKDVASESEQAALKPFGALSPAEVAVLPAEIQFRVPAISCPLLNARPPGSNADGGGIAVACGGDSYKYLLDIAKVTGADLEKAEAHVQQDGEWVVSVNFTTAGQSRWTELTKEAFQNAGSACAPSAVGAQGHCQIAITRDNVVISAPEILGVLTGQAIVSGGFKQPQAKLLAAQLSFASLPVAFEVVSIDFVRP